MNQSNGRNDGWPFDKFDIGRFSKTRKEKNTRVHAKRDGYLLKCVSSIQRPTIYVVRSLCRPLVAYGFAFYIGSYSFMVSETAVKIETE